PPSISTRAGRATTGHEPRPPRPDARRAPASPTPAGRPAVGSASCRRSRDLRPRCRPRRGAARQPHARPDEHVAANGWAGRTRHGDGHRPQVIGADRRLERWVVEHRVSWLNDVFVWLSKIGAHGLVWIAIALVLAIVWRRPRILLLVVAAVIAADL